MDLPIYPLAARGREKKFLQAAAKQAKSWADFPRKSSGRKRGSNLWHRNESSLAFSLSLSIVSLPILFSQLRRKRKRKRKKQRCLRLSFTFPSEMLDFRRKVKFSSSRYACTHFRTFWARTEEENEMGGKNRREPIFLLRATAAAKVQKKKKKEKRTNRAAGSYFSSSPGWMRNQSQTAASISPSLLSRFHGCVAN